MNRFAYSGWLPAIASGNERVWLPLRTSSVAALCEAVTSATSIGQYPNGQDHNKGQDPINLSTSERQARNALSVAMRDDPSLVLATLAHRFAVGEATAAKLSNPMTLLELAGFWCREGRRIWQATDWLACPDLKTSARYFEGFDRLDHYFQTLPLRRWPEHAALWWTVTKSPAPPGSFTEVQLAASDEHTKALRPAHDVIARMISLRESSDRLSAHATTAIDGIKKELAHSLAYGLSHEINNPLANISTRAQTLAKVVGETSQRHSLLRIVDQTSRAHAMIADLMFYANAPNPNLRQFDLEECLSRTLEAFADDAQAYSISLRLCWDSERPFDCVDGDPEMIGEAVAVLVRNSIQAIGTDGVVQVRVSSQGDAGGGCQIRVCDSGPGIEPVQAAKAFDPYYSGREAGRGLGLGLCRAQRIMDLHGGSVSLEPALAGCVATLSW